MATTYTLIASSTATASTLTFSSIPATYTDLVFKMSARTDRGGATDAAYLSFNGSSTAVYSQTLLYSVSTSLVNQRASNQGPLLLNNAFSGDTNTANTFVNFEMYIPNYASTTSNKPFSVVNANESNTVNGYNQTWAGLWRNTSAINSITITIALGTAYIAGTSFYLYGIKNS